MASMNENNDVDHMLTKLSERETEARSNLQDRTFVRINSEIRKLSRQERKLGNYLAALGGSLEVVLSFTPQEAVDTAIHLISLLENESLAREIQPDVPLPEYEYWQSVLLPDAYHELATAMATVHGYNSKSMHQCIADGIEVSRRCGDEVARVRFREFAVEVYRSANDIDMALHFARSSLNLDENQDVGRRVASADDVASLLALQGNLEAAVDAVMMGWKFISEFHNPYMAELLYTPMARAILSLAGRQDLLKQFPALDDVTSTEHHCGRVLSYPEADESPKYTIVRDKALFTEECCRGDYDRAIKRLTPWDRRLLDSRQHSNWFEIRLRLMAAFRLTGRTEKLQALAAPLREIATKANDWLTLHRLERILDPTKSPTPAALAGDPTIGPFAAVPKESQSVSDTSSPTIASPATMAADDAAPQDHDDHPESPAEAIHRLSPFLQKLIATEGDPDKLNALMAELLQVPAGNASAEDVEQLLTVARYAAPCYPDSAACWRWAQSLTAGHTQSAKIVSLLAALGADLRNVSAQNSDDGNAVDAAIDQLIPASRIESLFEKSVDLTTDDPEVYARAGMYYLNQDQMGEAERLLARSFRLDRTDRLVAWNLSEVYSRTDRRSDALAVLDLAIREGCDDPGIAWQAALCAYSLGRFSVMLTYLDRFESQVPDQPETNHYRACALLELDRGHEALAAIARERELNPEMDFASDLQQASAYGQLKQLDEFSQHLQQILAVRFSSIEALTVDGLRRLLQQLWKNCTLPGHHPLVQELRKRLLECCFAPSSLIEQERISASDEEQTNVELFHCIVRQPLGPDWADSHACLAGEQRWTAYDVVWGVLAPGPDEAAEIALSWQSQCWHSPAEVLDVSATGQQFLDIPGVVFQSRRSPPQPA